VTSPCDDDDDYDDLGHSWVDFRVSASLHLH